MKKTIERILEEKGVKFGKFFDGVKNVNPDPYKWNHCEETKLEGDIFCEGEFAAAEVARNSSYNHGGKMAVDYYTYLIHRPSETVEKVSTIDCFAEFHIPHVGKITYLRPTIIDLKVDGNQIEVEIKIDGHYNETGSKTETIKRKYQPTFVDEEKEIFPDKKAMHYEY